MTDEEKAVLKTAKANYGLTNAEQKILVNLIEKQSKEIEELKEKDDANLAYYDQIYQNGIYTGQKAVEDKIKAKIEELNNKLKNADEIEAVFIIKQQQVLQSLLEKE